MSRQDLLALRIQQLEKREEDMELAARLLAKMRMKSKEYFERRYKSRINQNNLEVGQLVLMRNNQIEKELNRKTKDRYLGPFVVVRQNQGETYELKELDGTRRLKPVAAFRLLHQENGQVT